MTTSTILNFDAITDEDRGLFDDIQFEVLCQLQQTISTAKGASGDDEKHTADQFVAYLTSHLAEKLNEVGGSEVYPYTWSLWKVFTYAAACTPPDHPAQNILVQILLALQASETQWKDLPAFGMFMRDEWNESPTFEVLDQSATSDDTDQPEMSLDEWLNVNAFVARVFRDVQPSFRTFGIWELRGGLEGDPTKDEEGKPFPQAAVDTKVRVAAEWVIRAGDRLWKDSLLGIWADVTDTRAFIGGNLIPAINGLNLERWGFWKRRFVEVRGVVQDQAAGDAVDRALEIMIALEKKAAEAL